VLFDASSIEQAQNPVIGLPDRRDPCAFPGHGQPERRQTINGFRSHLYVSIRMAIVTLLQHFTLAPL
jgi:hypothetical protein